MGKHKSKRKKIRSRKRPTQVKTQLETRGFQQAIWKKIPKAIWWLVGAVALFVTLVEAYPWLSIQEGVTLNPSNPYSELLEVSNQGYVPLSDLSATCRVGFHLGRISVSNARLHFPKFARYLGHGGSVTVPCFSTLNIPTTSEGATLDLRISYGFYPLPASLFHRQQAFHFKSVMGKGGTEHWIQLSP